MGVPVRAVASDYGGVVGAFSHGLSVRRIAELGGCTEEEAVERIFRSGLEEAFDCGRLTPAEFLLQLRWQCRIPAGVPDETLTDIWMNIFSRTGENERVISVLRRIPPEVSLVLASNTNALHFRAIRELFDDFLAACDALVLSFQVGQRKPAAPFFEAVLRAAGAEPAETLFIDDRPDFVDAACSLGLRGLLYEPGLDLAAELARLGVPLWLEGHARAKREGGNQ